LHNPAGNEKNGNRKEKKLKVCVKKSQGMKEKRATHTKLKGEREKDRRTERRHVGTRHPSG